MREAGEMRRRAGVIASCEAGRAQALLLMERMLELLDEMPLGMGENPPAMVSIASASLTWCPPSCLRIDARQRPSPDRKSVV